jgi:hypothetical protein
VDDFSIIFLSLFGLLLVYHIQHHAFAYVCCDIRRRAEEKEQEEKIQELYAQIGELTTKVNWLKKKSGLDV